MKGARYGPTFHEAGGRGGRTIGTKRTLLVEILGLPLAARADSRSTSRRRRRPRSPASARAWLEVASVSVGCLAWRAVA